MRVDTTSIRCALDALQWRVLPGVCVLCSQRSFVAMDLCPHCRATLPWVGRACVSCALPLADPGTAHCNACKGRPPPFCRAVAPLGYIEPVTRMVHRLKFRGNPIDARVLGTLLADAICAAYERDALPQLVLPVPLSRARLMRRGHNQAALLARWVGAALAL
ncbi:MAG TPA: double zinc ribbon domain-containing protein, partial [Pseudomonadales bacterium]